MPNKDTPIVLKTDEGAYIPGTRTRHLGEVGGVFVRHVAVLHDGLGAPECDKIW